MRKLRTPSILGKKYGRLTVVGRTENKKGLNYWICECECGNETNASKYALEHPEKGKQSCGCLNKEVRTKKTIEWNRTHSGKDHPKYKGLITKHNGYEIILQKGHPCADKRGYASIHNLKAYEAGVWKKGCVVHHVDKVRNNNDDSNLIVFDSNKDHQVYHSDMEQAMVLYIRDNNLMSDFLDKNKKLNVGTIADAKRETNGGSKDSQ